MGLFIVKLGILAFSVHASSASMSQPGRRQYNNPYDGIAPVRQSSIYIPTFIVELHGYLRVGLDALGRPLFVD
jgi:hypothetical protein